MVICVERGADLHMAQLMPLPLTFSCFSKIQIGVTFLVPAHMGSRRQRAIKQVCVCVIYNFYGVCGALQVMNEGRVIREYDRNLLVSKKSFCIKLNSRHKTSKCSWIRATFE